MSTFYTDYTQGANLVDIKHRNHKFMMDFDAFAEESLFYEYKDHKEFHEIQHMSVSEI